MTEEEMPILSEDYYVLMIKLSKILAELEKAGYRANVKVFKIKGDKK